jgi:hypothetical protein
VEVLNSLSGEFQHKSQLIGGTFRKAGGADCAVFFIVQMVWVSGKAGMVGRIIKSVKAAGLPPARSQWYEYFPEGLNQMSTKLASRSTSRNLNEPWLRFPKSWEVCTMSENSRRAIRSRTRYCDSKA